MIDDLVVRMTKLEKQHRRLWASFAGVLVLFGLALVSGQARPRPAKPMDIVTARKFVLVDAQGRQRGRWWINGNEAVFSVTTGKSYAGLFAADGEATVLLGADGIKALLRSTSNDAALLFDNTDNAMGMWYSDKKHGSALTIYDKHGRAIFRAP